MKDDAMTTLTEFLLARIDEDEAAARDVFYEGQHWYAEEEHVARWPGDVDVWDGDRKRDAAHVVRWQPARVLAECDAKRRIVEKCGAAVGDDDWDDDNVPTFADETLRLLALPYADHADYDEAWRP